MSLSGTGHSLLAIRLPLIASTVWTCSMMMSSSTGSRLRGWTSSSAISTRTTWNVAS